MASCRFCLTEIVDTWFGSWCARCHKLQRMIALFSGEKMMDVLTSVLITDDNTREEKIKQELKTELVQREYKLRKRKQAEEK